MMKTSVLVVDNEKSIRESLTMALSKDYVTYEAFNGIEAIDVLEKHDEIKLVLSDLMMPGMGGMELIEILRNRNKSIIIILMTAAYAEDVKKESMKKGADFFLQKPIDLNVLESAMHSLLDSKPALYPE